MPLVALLKGVNVGGHRTFRPAALARDLAHLGAVNLGAAGTFVFRHPVTRTRLREEIHRRLPFVTDLMIVDGREILRLVASDPFAGQPAGAGYMQFVSTLAKRPRPLSPMPHELPPGARWSIRILACRDRFVIGILRREMRAIRHLGDIEKLVGCSATTRNWNTIRAIAELVRDQRQPPTPGSRSRGSRGGRLPSSRSS
jgi:uncharacterized protein (DUF1697 family)